LKVTASLDPTEGRRYVETVKGKDLENMYNMIALMEYHVNPTTNGVIIWISIRSCLSYSKEDLDNWQQRLC